ncbi:hypothetical protein PRK78_002863 [Emydomyces testavorans]|uniref:Uncharacterized protein n=1 Tax=Emydomyces testavorans TaxID=2070801 RepID=A0AAF0DH50_9EURO|nr:hypothetical protein PRK78_002863 [Emydomyces testavorans]
METPSSPPFDGPDGNEEHPGSASSSLVGTTSTRDEEYSSHGSEIDVDSLPHQPNGMRAPFLSSSPLPDQMISEEHFLKLNARFRHNLSIIREERDQALERWQQAKRINSRLIEALQVERAKRAELEEYLKPYKSTEIAHIPVWPLPVPLAPPPSTTMVGEDEEIATEDQPFGYLYNNPLYQGYELNVNIIIHRVKTLIENQCLVKAAMLIEEALEKAEKLNYIPIYAKCLYWKGRVLHLQDRWQEAAKAFLDARPCIGRYREGEELKQWLTKYEVYIEELFYEQELEIDRATRKRPSRGLCVPAAEMPHTP